MTGIRVRNERSQEVGIGDTPTLVLGGSDTLFTLLAVVEELSHEEMLYFVGYSVLVFISLQYRHHLRRVEYHGVVRKIRRRLIRG